METKSYIYPGINLHGHLSLDHVLNFIDPLLLNAFLVPLYLVVVFEKAIPEPTVFHRSPEWLIS